MLSEQGRPAGETPPCGEGTASPTVLAFLLLLMSRIVLRSLKAMVNQSHKSQTRNKK